MTSVVAVPWRSFVLAMIYQDCPEEFRSHHRRLHYGHVTAQKRLESANRMEQYIQSVKEPGLCIKRGPGFEHIEAKRV